MRDKSLPMSDANLPSIVAHSFGTYILGYSLLRYENIRFDKVVLCGSILPQEYPWNEILDRGQVAAVLNEFGSEDIWSKIVRWFVAGTGASGQEGFWSRDPCVIQKRFSFKHSEYFERGHIEENWLPFMNKNIATRPRAAFPVHSPRPNLPWGLYIVYIIVLAILIYSFVPWERLLGGAETSALQSQLTAAQSQLTAAHQRIASLEAALRSRTGPTTTPPVQSVPSAPNLSPVDRATNLEIWKSVDDDCLRVFVNTYNWLDGALNDWSQKIKANRAAFMSDLSGVEEGFRQASTCLDKLRRENSAYKDISEILVQPYTGLIQKAIENFLHAINDLPQTLPENYDAILRQPAGELRVGATDLVNWIGDMQRIANQKVSELSGRR